MLVFNGIHLVSRDLLMEANAHGTAALFKLLQEINERTYL